MFSAAKGAAQVSSGFPGVSEKFGLGPLVARFCRPRGVLRSLAGSSGGGLAFALTVSGSEDIWSGAGVLCVGGPPRLGSGAMRDEPLGCGVVYRSRGSVREDPGFAFQGR